MSIDNSCSVRKSYFDISQLITYYRGVNIWSALPEHIQNESNRGNLKTLLKNHVFDLFKDISNHDCINAILILD